MAVTPRAAVISIAVTILVLSAVTDVVTNNALAAKKHRDQPHITFSSPHYSLEKMKEDIDADREGWSETARWENASGDDLVYVHIFAHVSYNRIIMSSHVSPPDKRVSRITGGKRVILGARGKAEIERGFYEHQAYSVEGIPCVYIQGYWADKSFGGVDVVRGAKPSDKIVGNHMLQVVVCDQRKKKFERKDVTEILSSISLRDAHWSTDWFISDIDPELPAVVDTDTALDNQEVVKSGQDIADKEISGTYRSEITSSVPYWFQLKKHRKMKVTLKQVGKTITGTDSIGRSELTGTIDGDTIKFNYWSGRTLKGNEVNGEWKITGDGSRLEGFWTWKGSPYGKWNLTRIE